MTGKFNYEKVYMGFAPKGADRENYQLLKSDYRLKLMTAKVPQIKGKLLDIGCGGGTMTEGLAKFYPQAEIYACDISRKAIELARRSGRGKVHYSLIKRQILPFQDNFFDTAVCIDVLEHVPDVFFFVKEAKRVLKKNGLFYLVVPCEGQPFTLTRLFQKIKIFDKLTFKHLGHIHPEFTHDYLSGFFTGFNFKVFDRKFSFHLLSQIITFFQYYLAKEILELIMGKKQAENYYDSSVIEKPAKAEAREHIIMTARELLFKIAVATGIFGKLENRLFSNMEFTAGKVHLFLRNIK